MELHFTVLSLTCSSFASNKYEQSCYPTRKKKKVAKPKSTMFEAWERALAAVWHFSVSVITDVEVPYL